jgi:hypothetical protein
MHSICTIICTTWFLVGIGGGHPTSITKSKGILFHRQHTQVMNSEVYCPTPQSLPIYETIAVVMDTEMYRMYLVLFGTKNRNLVPISAAIHVIGFETPMPLSTPQILVAGDLSSAQHGYHPH